MEEKRVKRSTNKKTNTSKKGSVRKTKVSTTSKKKNIKPIIIIDYTFLISLILTIIFGMQTNGAFMLPFVITLAITIVCMCIILVNSIFSKIKKRMQKSK